MESSSTGLVPEDHGSLAFLLACEEEKAANRLPETAWKAFLANMDPNKASYGQERIFSWMTLGHLGYAITCVP